MPMVSTLSGFAQQVNRSGGAAAAAAGPGAAARTVTVPKAAASSADRTRRDGVPTVLSPELTSRIATVGNGTATGRGRQPVAESVSYPTTAVSRRVAPRSPDCAPCATAAPTPRPGAPAG